MADKADKVIGPRIDRRFRVNLEDWLYGNRWVGVHSSNVRSIRYDLEASILAVQYHRGPAYLFYNVTLQSARFLFLSGSIGRFIRAGIMSRGVKQIAK